MQSSNVPEINSKILVLDLIRHEKYFPVLPEFETTSASVERVNSKELVSKVSCSIPAASYAQR